MDFFLCVLRIRSIQLTEKIYYLVINSSGEMQKSKTFCHNGYKFISKEWKIGYDTEGRESGG